MIQPIESTVTPVDNPNNWLSPGNRSGQRNALTQPDKTVKAATGQQYPARSDLIDPLKAGVCVHVDRPHEPFSFTAGHDRLACRIELTTPVPSSQAMPFVTRTAAVIGAGISGLICARRMRDAGSKVTVFEKSRGVGGRMATRRAADGFAFDHGTQYFTVRDKRSSDGVMQNEVRRYAGNTGS